jgi:nucleotide-binding universal stress UspA family protein
MATIVVGIDDSDHARRALRWALDEARVRDARVIATHAWGVPIVPYGPGVGAVAIDAGEFEQAAHEAVDRMVGDVLSEEATSGVEVERRSVEGGAAGVLIDTARKENADLLVVGTRGHGGFTGLLLGSVSATLAHHTPCPLVIVPPEDRE